MFPRNGGGVVPDPAVVPDPTVVPDPAPEVVPEPTPEVVPEPAPEAVVPLPAVPEVAPEVVVPEPGNVVPEAVMLPVAAIDPDPLPVVAGEPEDDPDDVFCGVEGVLEQAPPKPAAAKATNPDVARPTARVVFERCKRDIGNLQGP